MLDDLGGSMEIEESVTENHEQIFWALEKALGMQIQQE